MTYKRGHVHGASKSLNKTISEIMDFLGDEGDREGKDGKLRSVLHLKIGDLAERWYRRGFNRGHRESYSAFKSGGEVPVRLEVSKKRNLAPNQHRILVIRSKIKMSDQ